MKYIDFDESRKLDLVLLGRVAIDFNPAYSDVVKEEFKPLKKVHYFEKYVGGSPANIAVGVTHHGMKAGFIGKVSDDQFGEFVVDYFNEQGIDTSCITKCTNGEKLGLTFTEMLSPIVFGRTEYPFFSNSLIASAVSSFSNFPSLFFAQTFNTVSAISSSPASIAAERSFR